MKSPPMRKGWIPDWRMPASLMYLIKRLAEYLWPAIILVLAQLAGMLVIYILMN